MKKISFFILSILYCNLCFSQIYSVELTSSNRTNFHSKLDSLTKIKSEFVWESLTREKKEYKNEFLIYFCLIEDQLKRLKAKDNTVSFPDCGIVDKNKNLSNFNLLFPKSIVFFAKTYPIDNKKAEDFFMIYEMNFDSQKEAKKFFKSVNIKDFDSLNLPYNDSLIRFNWDSEKTVLIFIDIFFPGDKPELNDFEKLISDITKFYP
jgi:hypothetical protein